MEEEERLRAVLLSRLAPAPPGSEGSSRPPDRRLEGSGQLSAREGRDNHRTEAKSAQHVSTGRIEEQEVDVQWDALLGGEGREELDSLLFPPGAFIRAGSALHREFGDFLEKYAIFRKKELSRALSASRREGGRNVPDGEEHGASATGKEMGAAGKSSSKVPMNPLFQRKLAEFAAEMPAEYDQRYRINFAVVPPRQRAQVQTQVLGIEEVKEAKRALLLFEDFRQRKSIAKIRKMREAQRALPIFQFRDEIVAAVRRDQVVLVAGDTGCGKSTQVPQYLIQAGFDCVACTQPRRISTMSLCARVATETLNEHGSQVAYQIRFESNRTERTKILFLTEGLLLRQLSTDPLLKQYSVIIIDEVHERHLTGDLLLAVLRSVLSERADLRVVLMSATINTKLFSDYFGATVIKVPGRLYPISLEYIPVEFDADGRPSAPQECGKGLAGRKEAGIATAKLPGAKPKPFDAKPYVKLLQRLDDQYPKGERGDMLVFLSGMNEISALADGLREYALESRRWIILKLHSSLPIEEQDKVFDIAPDSVRKCILSTNIAETSVTIDGIRFVVDSGKVKEMAFESDMALHSLQEFWISKASANQRKGRAGRTGPGVCFRFYSQEQYDAFLDFSVPEIHRVPLEATALQIKTMGLGDPRSFPWVEAPPKAHMLDAMERLRQLQAITGDVDEEVLPLGAVLSQLPVDLAIGKLLICSTIFGLEDELMTIAAGLSIQSPFVRVDAGSSESTNRQQFVSEEGDPFTLLNVYDEWIRVKASKENSKKWSRRHGVEEQRLYEMTRLKDQFADLLKSAGLLQVETLTQARNRVARSNPDRSWKRKQLKKLQKERELSKKTRVLEMDGALGAGASADGNEPEDANAAGDAGEVDLKALDFELAHDLSAMSDVSSRDLTLRQVNLVKMALASSLHPNVALADPGNVNRRIDEAVFVTPRKPLTAMHPTSVFGASPSLVGPADLIVYSQLLETTKAWVMNGTRCPLLATALMCSTSIDTNRACSRILVDNWLELSVRGGGKLGEKMLYLTQQLRHALSCCLASRLATCSHASVAEAAEKAVHAHASGDGGGDGGEVGPACVDEDLPALLGSLREEVKRKSFLSDLELQSKVADLFELDVKYSSSICARSKVMWQVLHPEVRAMGNTADAMRRAMQDARKAVLPDGQMDARVLEQLKGGVKVCAGLRFGSLHDGPVRAGGFESVLQHNTACSKCQQSMLVTLEELLMHEESCTGLASTPQQSQGRPMGKPESGEAGLKLAPSHAEAISEGMAAAESPGDDIAVPAKTIPAASAEGSQARVEAAGLRPPNRLEVSRGSYRDGDDGSEGEPAALRRRLEGLKDGVAEQFGGRQELSSREKEPWRGEAFAAAREREEEEAAAAAGAEAAAAAASAAEAAARKAAAAEDVLVVTCETSGCLPLAIESAAELLSRGGEVLKAACSVLGLKCGGTPEQRAQRLMMTKGVPRAEWPRNILADTSAPSTKRKRGAG